MKTRFFFSGLFFLVLITSCTTTTKIKTTTPVLFKGLSSPVYLEKDSTKINLRDYILYPQEIDSILLPPNIAYKWDKKNHSLLLLPSQPMETLDKLELLLTNGERYTIPLFGYDKKQMKISFDDKKGFEKVQLKGEMTNWQIVDLIKKGRKWVFEKDVTPGLYQYVLVINGKETPDFSNPNKVSNGMGAYNSFIKIDGHENKVPHIKTHKIFKNGFSIRYDNRPQKLLVFFDNHLLDSKNIEIHKDEALIFLPKIPDLHAQVRIYAANEFGRGNDLLVPVNKDGVISDSEELSSNDFHKQIMYFLMIDRFYNGDKKNDFKIENDTVLPKANYYGGDLAGVIKKIKEGYFERLGVNTLWLSPITQNPMGAYGKWKNPYTKFSGYHGYWPVSNTKIDFRFGNDSIFKLLLKEAHHRDMKVLLDYVANHVHKENPIYKEHPDWATDLYLPDGTLNTEKWDSHRLTTWFDTFLPTLDFSKPEVVDAMTDTAAYWVKKFNLDGFRHDATKHIQQSFWRDLTWKIKTGVDRPVFQIGETYGSPELIRSYINTGMLDAQFDFNLYDASVSTFANNDTPIKRLGDQLKESLKYYGHHHLMGNITGNQDRVRFISYASGDVRFDEDGKTAGWTRQIKISDSTAFNKLLMLHAFNLSIPGVPSIYYGDEIGLPGANDPDNRRMMKFNNLTLREKGLKKEVSHLIHLRKKSMPLLYGTTDIETKGNILIVTREYFGDKTISIFNKTNQDFIYKKDTIPAQNFKIISIQKPE